MKLKKKTTIVITITVTTIITELMISKIMNSRETQNGGLMN